MATLPPWDLDVHWHADLITQPTLEPLDLAFVRDHHLRAANDAAEDAYIDRLITISRRMAERYTARAIMPQTWRLVLDRFPRSGWIEVPYPPLIAVTSLEYRDAADALQLLDAASYRVSAPAGPTAAPGRIEPVSGGSWPSVIVGFDAVTITFEAGYQDLSSPPLPDVPEDLIHGMLLVIGELYKQRSLSVHALNQDAALLSAEALWRPYKMFYGAA